jgi:16S rRNA (uracil1498-N3)-methyltransferase
MTFPFFYSDKLGPDSQTEHLDENAAKHIHQVLRMKKGDKINLTNGRGILATAAIEEQHKKECIVALTDIAHVPVYPHTTEVAISLVKNAARFEWFLEKATEMGVSSIVPLVCERTERAHFRRDRMHNIMISAMLQSRQTWLPELSDPIPFAQWISSPSPPARCIAHCLPDQKRHFREMASGNKDIAIAIGPEGDFTDNEISRALENKCIPVSLGETRLRTETAGLVAATLMRIQ